MSKKMTRRPRNAPRQHAERLLRILESILARATDPALRERLQRAIAALRRKSQAA
jgi:hypothetical protein